MGEGGKVLEVQIRTGDMHREAEFGICAHWHYKGVDAREAGGGYEEKIGWLRQVLGWGEELDAGELLAEVVVQVLPNALLRNLGDVEDLGLKTPSIGDVPQDPGEEAAAADRELTHGEVDGEDGPVLASTKNLAADADDAALPGFAVAGEVAVMPGPVWLGHEGVDVLPEELPGAPSEHPFGGRVDGVDPAAVVDGDDALDGGVEDSAQAGIAVLKVRCGIGRRRPGHGCLAGWPRGLGGALAAL